MRYFNTFIQFIFYLTFSFIIFFSSTQASNNKIIVKVDDQIITSFELKNKIKTVLLLRNLELIQENIDKVKNQSIFYLLNLKLKENELKKFNIEIKNIDILKQIESTNSIDIQTLKKKFNENGIDFDLFYNEVKTNLAWQKFIFSTYNNKIDVDEKNLNLEIDQIIKNQSNILNYKISEIELELENEVTMAKKIDLVKKKIKEIGFENTAIQYSISNTASQKGNLGWINEKALSPQFYKIIKDMKIGEISQPIKQISSLTILKLNDKKITNINDLNAEKLKLNLIQKKKLEMFTLYSKSHLSKLKNNSFIVYE